jgi:hypothetical protein
MAIEIAVLELDPSPVRRFRDEADLYLTRPLEIGLELPPRAYVPAEDERAEARSIGASTTIAQRTLVAVAWV